MFSPPINPLVPAQYRTKSSIQNSEGLQHKIFNTTQNLQNRFSPILLTIQPRQPKSPTIPIVRVEDRNYFMCPIFPPIVVS